MDQQPFGGIETFFARREWTADGQRILGAEIRLPRPADRSNRAARRIDRFYQLQCRAYLRYCERWLLPLAAEEARRALACGAPPPEAEAALTFCSAYAADGLWSLWTESRERVGGRTERQRRGDTWDTRTGYPLPLSAFFPAGGGKAELLRRAEAEIRRQTDCADACFREDWRRQLRRCFSRENFYVTPQGLVLFYPMYALGPAAEGIPCFCLPFGEGGWGLPSPADDGAAGK